jgi:predicted MarR family transcription regulator
MLAKAYNAVRRWLVRARAQASRFPLAPIEHPVIVRLMMGFAEELNLSDGLSACWSVKKTSGRALPEVLEVYIR